VRQMKLELEDEFFMLSASQLRVLLESQANATMLETIEHLRVTDPHRTNTARKLIMPTILQIEAKHNVQH
jgi:hypothetical protein